MRAPYSIRDGLVTLVLRVQPGASRTGWAGRYGDTALRLRLAAPPVDGKANKACIRYLAESLGVPLGSVSIQSGEKSRDKVVTVSSVTPQAWSEFVRTWSPGSNGGTHGSKRRHG